MQKYRFKILGALLPMLILTSGASLEGCTPDASQHDDPSRVRRDLGDVAMSLDLAPGVSVLRVRYQITGNGFSKAGVLDASGQSQLSLLVGGIPAGRGYSITLEALGAADAVLCTGAATFDISARQTTQVSLALSCRLATVTGSVAVDVGSNLCPRLDDLTVVPASADVGNTIGLTALATDVDGKPASVTYAWASTLGTLSSASAASTVLTCTSAGEGTVSLTYSDGACSDTTSVTVRCVGIDAGTGADAGPDGGDAGTPDSGVPAGRIRITEWMYDGTGGEYVELTNVGGTPVDLTGYSYDDDSALLNQFSLSGLGVVQPGESVVFTESTAASFRSAWNLCAGVKLLGGYTNNLGRADQINIFDASGALVDRLTYGDQTIPGSIRTTGASGWVSAAGLGANNALAWTLSNVGDAEGSYASTGNAVGSPGKSTRGSVSYDPCNASAPDAGTPDGGTDAGSDAGADAGLSFQAWPGVADISVVDAVSTFTGDLSGLTYEPATASSPARLWAVENGNGLLFRLELIAGIWTPSSEAGWSLGKALSYPDGTGRPDSEGVTKAGFGSSTVYVASERNNAASGVSRPSILRFDTAQNSATLTATHEFSLVSDLPVVGANLGPEAVTWVSDDYLVAHGFYNESAAAPYAPAAFNHAGGVFFVGLEANGTIYAYVLDHDHSTAQRVATIQSGFPGVMGLEFDPDVGQLWASCDNTCQNRSTLLAIDEQAGSPTRGRFVLRRGFERPAGLPNANNEGLAFAPESECSGGQKRVFWADDDDTDGYSLRQGFVSCGAH